MKKLSYILLFVLLFSSASCGGRTNAAVIIAGSTSVQPYAEVLAEEFALLRPDCEIDIQGGGSSAGITAVESGIANLGMSSRALYRAEERLWSVEIAKDGLAIIVHPDNPVSGLTIEQVRGIYSGEITNWLLFGGGDAAIHIIAREEGSGTRSAFQDLAMNKQNISPKAIVQDSNGAVRQLVSGDPNSIGFISLGLVDSTVKALSLDGAAAVWANVNNGSYSLYRPFLFISENAPEGDSKDFIDFILSEAGQNVLTHEGLVTGGGR